MSSSKRRRSRGLRPAPHLIEGIPYLQIVEAAKGHQADLVVIGTHGRTGLSHMMLGSVAERVVRTSEVPVLTIRSAGSP
ncbi:MAG: universal stress protein [Armatimonadota bacterium]